MDDLKWCINYLKEYNKINSIISKTDFNTFRGLMNITLPLSLSDEYYLRQDKVIKEELSKRKIIDVNELIYKNNIALYKGDITSLKADAIVNACNEKLLGCFYPLHNCIDNMIHSYSGLQVRNDLYKIMKEQNKDEENGKCKVTKGYNLFSKYIFHTVGPKVIENVTKQDEIDLKNCYLSCLTKANKMNLNSIVFPCISTGIYNFDQSTACDIAFKTVSTFLKENNSKIKVIFNVFKDTDYYLYKEKIGDLNDY
ncbi:MAG: protein-ADP-ribose hydrolase [Candidatus Caccosoma sp.]|nr:protein-ADP-ribose hydrolase [Candidatus Caccosoma sp.]